MTPNRLTPTPTPTLVLDQIPTQIRILTVVHQVQSLLILGLNLALQSVADAGGGEAPPEVVLGRVMIITKELGAKRSFVSCCYLYV